VAARLEPALERAGGLVCLHGYPAACAALARLDPDDPRKALRVEAYLDGVELANGWVELTDAAELRARWAAEAVERPGPAPPADIHLLAEMTLMPPPPTVGMALGVDRLMAALLGHDGLEQVLPFRLDFGAR
jgi:lysyl-tRNA synthetase class 2